MQQDSLTFWADIKNYEERLAQDPDSYIFARLSDVYLKVNLIDDALYIARKGVAKYPSYIAGQRALAMASYAKGLLSESRLALEAIAAALPEDVEVMKLLGKLLVTDGSLDAARKVYRTALEFSPADEECQGELHALSQGSTITLEDDEEIIELQESDIVEELEPVFEATPEFHDPLPTSTLAELYVQQNFVDKALEIYRTILAEDPANNSVRSRVSELEALVAASSVELNISNSSELIHTTVFQESGSRSPSVLAQGTADSVISTLEGWLDNIRRIKACR